MLKRWMAAAMAAVMLMSMNVCALAQEDRDAAQITVQGTAKISADPDLVEAYIFEINALRARYNTALRRCRARFEEERP